MEVNVDQELYVVAIDLGGYTVPTLVSYVSGSFRRNRSADVSSPAAPTPNVIVPGEPEPLPLTP